MDASITRRGQPCWYKSENVGMVAINDAFILESCIYIFLKKYFKKTDYYVELIELFHEVSSNIVVLLKKPKLTMWIRLLSKLNLANSVILSLLPKIMLT
jgi:hypothetical protein